LRFESGLPSKPPSRFLQAPTTISQYINLTARPGHAAALARRQGTRGIYLYQVTKSPTAVACDALFLKKINYRDYQNRKNSYKKNQWRPPSKKKKKEENT
jgi:uncharacterized C2H2 Zn-finger protein